MFCQTCKVTYTPRTDYRDVHEALGHTVIATPEHRTVDGVLITPGLRVCNYDRRISYVEESQFASGSLTSVHGEYFDGWFDMRDKNGNRMSAMNGERMTTRIPSDLAE